MKDTISHLHVLCNDWARELSFYKSELPYFQKRLEEIATDYTSKEVKAQVDHFQNRMIIMHNAYDELLHDLNLKNQEILGKAAINPKYINAKMVEVDDKILDMIAYTAQEYKDFKTEFYRFLAKYM
jgi:ABC-type Zn uptake system ZnuABC Zn-binding protein ZnuA